jgi:hypothetical protein
MLNRPEKLNAINLEMWAGIRDAVPAGGWHRPSLSEAAAAGVTPVMTLTTADVIVALYAPGSAIAAGVIAATSRSAMGTKRPDRSWAAGRQERTSSHKMGYAL